MDTITKNSIFKVGIDVNLEISFLKSVFWGKHGALGFVREKNEILYISSFGKREGVLISFDYINSHKTQRKVLFVYFFFM